MKNILFYVLFLICLLCLTFGLYEIVSSWNFDEVRFGMLGIAVSVFIGFILWKNSFFTKSKS